ncbi:Uncharacterised protein [Mycobacteroides abscessus subsp. abscessus]|nr:Uncharacterised protein [Mycobacteroides abscessus subsp. abscessus]
MGTAVDDGRPGTSSKCAAVLARAFTSVMTESTDSGSPATSRTTSTPVFASAMSSFATSVGSPSAGRTSTPCGNVIVGPVGATIEPAAASSVLASAAGSASAGCGPDVGGRSVPISASTASGTSGSVKTNAACAKTFRARVVNRPGSPGPEPTKVMRPGLCLRTRVVISHSRSTVR